MTGTRPAAGSASRSPRRPALPVACAAAALLLGGCSAAAAGTSAAGSTSTARPPAATAKASSPAATPSTASSALHPPAVAGVTWRAEGTTVAGTPLTYVGLTDGGAVGLLWIDAPAVRFRLVPGVKFPEGSPSTPADNTPSTWVPRMVAAFNGGFELKDHVGGYYIDHRVVSPLRPGLGALAITTGGRLTVGAWGRDLSMSPDIAVVRQDLPLLVDHGVAQTRPSDTPRTWGIANGGLWTANRSALGQLADGSLVYAYGHDVRPSDMSAAMVLVGAREAMVLDMNKSWPGGFVYAHAGGAMTGARIQPQEYHVPSVYYARYTKDFVAALLP